MSFYNVANPTSFAVVSDSRKQKTAQGKLTRTGDVQKFQYATGEAVTAEQLIGGILFVNPSTNAATLALPSATDFITLLMGPLGFDVSSNDIFTLRVFNYNAGANAASIIVGTGGSGSAISVAAGANKAINVQITITENVGAAPTYAYTMF